MPEQNKMNLKTIPTCDLVEELSTRKGVQRLKTPVEGQDEIAIEKEVYKNTMTSKELKANYIYDAVMPGPAIILRIID